MNEISKKLKAPFKNEELEFRIGALNSDKTMGLAFPYVQARAIQERLDKVVGIGNWKAEYREIQGGFICRLAIKLDDEWIEKEDGASSTEFESVKGGISSAFKRVASSGFGIGRYLYNARNKWFPIKSQGKSYTFISTPVLEINDKKEIDEEIEENREFLNKNIIVTFGKYKGMNIQEIYNNDKKYIKYLSNEAKDISLKNACQKLLVG